MRTTPSFIVRLTLTLIVTIGWATFGRADEEPPAATEAPVEAGEDKVPRPKPVPQPPPEDVAASIERGVAFLLADQNPDGSWGSAERTKGLNIYAPVPGAHHAFRVAVTAMCVATLIEVDPQRDDIRPALVRGEEWLLTNAPKLRRATADALYNTWGHGYTVAACARMLDYRADDDPQRHEIESCIRQQYDLLGRYESVDGGWGYYDFRAGTKRPASSSTSFQTAAILIAFHEAQEQGLPAPELVVSRGLDSLHRQQNPDFSYLYGEYLKWQPARAINRPGGSLGRSQACNLALRMWGDEQITDQVLIDWLDRLFARNLWLDIGRKRPIPHESWFQVAGYFYYFGHYYAAGCIEQLPAERRPEYQDHLATLLLSKQEKDGSWWDYPLYNYHQQYGTAFAVMALLKCKRAAGLAPAPNKAEP
jgi:hypothetical protein